MLVIAIDGSCRRAACTLWYSCCGYRFGSAHERGVEAGQVDFIPPSEIGMKLAEFGLVRLEGDAKALPYSIIAVVQMIMLTVLHRNLHPRFNMRSINNKTKGDWNEKIVVLTVPV
jgi:hypothetical protein